MKKLIAIALFFGCHDILHALQSATPKTQLIFGQLCGDDACQCPDHKKPEQII